MMLFLKALKKEVDKLLGKDLLIICKPASYPQQYMRNTILLYRFVISSCTHRDDGLPWNRQQPYGGMYSGGGCCYCS